MRDRDIKLKVRKEGGRDSCPVPVLAFRGTTESQPVGFSTCQLQPVFMVNALRGQPGHSTSPAIFSLKIPTTVDNQLSLFTVQH